MSMEAEIGHAGGEASAFTHPLLEELGGVLQRIKSNQQPVRDGQEHLVPLCETIEAIFRNGLKQPNSWFGLNKQDYWSWIEPLQNYYFNEKQNPLLRQVVDAIATSPKCNTVMGKGRCFIRVALCQKLLTVPIEHIAKNKRLTQYWYSNDSIVADSSLRLALLQLLFQLTEVEFELSVEHSSFLDETWVIPVYKQVQLPPIKTLDLKLSYVEGRALIVEVEKGCLAEKGGVGCGDMLDELCGEPVIDSTYGRLKQILQNHNTKGTNIELVIVKKHLADGSPFFPIMRRQLLNDYRASMTWDGGTSQPLKVPKRKPSIIVQSHGSSTEYTIVYLGRDTYSNEEAMKKDGLDVDHLISTVLNSDYKPQEVVVRVGPTEVILFSSRKKEVLQEFGYKVMCGCGTGSLHQTCFALLARADRQKDSLPCAYVLEAPSAELAQAICAHIAQGFNRSLWLSDKKTSSATKS